MLFVNSTKICNQYPVLFAAVPFVIGKIFHDNITDRPTINKLVRTKTSESRYENSNFQISKMNMAAGPDDIAIEMIKVLEGFLNKETD